MGFPVKFIQGARQAVNDGSQLAGFTAALDFDGSG